MIKTVLHRLHRLISDSKANVAIITAFCALPLLGIMGLSVDYGIIFLNKTRLDAAADAAAVAAVTKAKAVLNGGGTMTAAKLAGQAQGLASFSSNAGHLVFQSGTVTPNVTFPPSPDGQTLIVSVSYAMQSQSQFGKLLNVNINTVSGSSSSSTIVVPYYQFIFVVDISGSMSIGGTANDIAGMNADRNIQCAFACHDPSHNRGPDYRAIAKADGWTLKIDYINQAVQNFIGDLKTQTQGMAGVFSVGIYTYATYFNTLQVPTTNLTLAQTTAKTIDIENMQPLSISQGYTRTTTSLQSALALTTNMGDGTSPMKQATYFIFLSDGIEDIEGNMIYGRGTDVSYPTACAQMKNVAKVITIEAAYPVVSDNQYPILVAPFATGNPSAMQTAMQQCATQNSMAYMATDGPGINAAVKSALQQILQGLTRLTQ